MFVEHRKASVIECLETETLNHAVESAAQFRNVDILFADFERFVIFNLFFQTSEQTCFLLNRGKAPMNYLTVQLSKIIYGRKKSQHKFL